MKVYDLTLNDLGKLVTVENAELRLHGRLTGIEGSQSSVLMPALGDGAPTTIPGGTKITLTVAGLPVKVSGMDDIRLYDEKGK